jgi:hypothetical protein
MAQKHGEEKESVIDKLVKLMSMVSAEHLLINQLIRSISFEQAQLVDLTALDLRSDNEIREYVQKIVQEVNLG